MCNRVACDKVGCDKVVCDKLGCDKVVCVCDKAVGERWCVAELCVKDGVWQSCLCERCGVTKLCVKDGVGVCVCQSCV